MFPASAWSVTYIASGRIDADTVWSRADSPYVIQGNLTVSETAGLTIQPGVRIQFDGPYTLKIEGTLIARGNSQDAIVFTSSDPTVTVPGEIVFTGDAAVFGSDGGYQSGSILEYVVVEKLGSADTLGAVTLLGAYPYIHNSTFRNNGASAIYANSINGGLRIENNIIEFNSAPLGAGLFVAIMTGANVSLRGNNVSNNTASINGGGMYFTGAGDGAIMLSGNILDRNSAGSKGGGIYTYKIAMTMTGESVRDNIAGSDNGGGMYLQESQIDVSKSMILRNQSPTMGGGIFLNAGTYNFTDNVLAMNDSGTHGGGMDMHGLPTVTIDRSVVAGNKARDYGAGISMTEGICSITNSAVVSNQSANTIGIYVDATLQGNTIAYNSSKAGSQLLGSTIGIGEGASMNLSIHDNNIFNNATPNDIVSFDNGTTDSEAIVNAQANWWGAASIDTRIKIGDGVMFAAIDAGSPSASVNTNAPISPPGGVTAVPGTYSIKLQWNANPENDTLGYRVYWGSKPFPDHEHFVDVGNATNYEIQNLTSKEIQTLIGSGGFIGVTAYDSGYSTANDDAATPVDENQTQGHESWYALPDSTVKMVADPDKHRIKGDLVYMRITVNNIGPSVGDKEFVVTHTIIRGLSYYFYSNGTPALPPACTLVSEQQVTCTHARLAPNAADEIDILVKVVAADTSDAESTVTVHPIDFDINPAESRAEAILHVNAPDLEIRWSNAPEAKVKTGESVKYNVIAKNIGRVPALRTTLDVTIPAIFTIDALDARCTSVENESTRFSCDVGNLAGTGKAEVSIALNLTATMSGEAVLMATAFTDGDSDTVNNQALLPATITSQTQGSGGAEDEVTPPPPVRKKGGGGSDPAWLLMLLFVSAVRRLSLRYAFI